VCNSNSTITLSESVFLHANIDDMTKYT